MRLIKFTRYVASRYTAYFLRNVCMLVLFVLIDTVSVVMLAPIIDFVVAGAEGAKSPLTMQAIAGLVWLGLPVSLFSLLMLFLAMLVLRALLQALLYYNILKTKYAVLRDLVVGVFRDMLDARWLFFAGSRHGTLLNTLQREISRFGDGFGAAARLMASIAHLACYLALPLYLSWQITIASLAVGMLLALPFLFLGRISHRLGKENSRTGNEMTESLHESLAAVKVILGFANQKKVLTRYEELYDIHREVTLKSQTLSMVMPYLYAPLGFSVVTIALLLGQHLGTPKAELAVLLLALNRMAPIIGQLTGLKAQMDNFYPSYEQVVSLQNKARALKQESGTVPFPGIKERMHLEEVSYAYPANEPCLSDVSMEFSHGTMTAIVGGSGAGKSTLIDLLLGFDAARTGAVTIDGVRLQEYDMSSYRKRIGYVPQDPVLFNDTLVNNIRWAKEDATREEIEQSCVLANAADFIADLPKGFDTVVGDRGACLSGGQVQRVALARALIRKPDILFLDEATSALDTASERLIQQALERIAQTTTLIVVAHRLSTIVKADRIYVLDKGRVVESGTYQELIAGNGAFAKMVKLQSLSFAGA